MELLLSQSIEPHPNNLFFILKYSYGAEHLCLPGQAHWQPGQMILLGTSYVHIRPSCSISPGPSVASAKIIIHFTFSFTLVADYNKMKLYGK